MNNTKLLTRYATLIVLALPLGSAVGGTLSESPLSLKGAVPPNVLFAVSVEFPTANTAAYQGSNDYSASNEYLGYFDPLKCYAYDSANNWFYPGTAASSATDPTIAHTCGTTGYWSGNLLNWATMTGLDEFRYAMTGGYRYVDTAITTVIERTYQSGQGGASNFPNKTFVDTDGTSTPFAAGTTLSIQNQGRGVQMLVTPSGSTDVGTCVNPTFGGSFNCSGGISTVSTGTGACTAVTGSGTLASPYRCTTMSSAFSAGTPSNIVAVSPPTIGGGSAVADTVTCSTPQYDGIAPFECHDGIALSSNGHTATCNTWTGDGSSGSPFTCTAFSTFSGGEAFSVSGSPTISSFSSTGLGSNQTMSSVTCTVSGSSPTTTTCSSGGHTATCNTYSGSGSSGSPYKCTSFGFDSGEVYVSSSNKTNTTTVGGRRYYYKYSVTYKPVVTQTYYYASSYPGATGAGYYYTSTYNLTWGTAQSYYVRAKVCDSIGYEDNCVQYGSSHKPTGVIQDNGDRMRFGVFSYYNANDIDNAVMRSKLKDVAPLKYSPSGTPIANGRAEWSADDGTLVQDPDDSDSATANSYVGATTKSGVINYINQFGRTAQSYKTYDNIGKLYYEALKYLRGQQATPDFYEGARASNADGFPVISNWDDPVQYSCQKNYIITMGDTHTHCDKRLPGGSISGYGSSQCNAYTDSNGHAHPADSGSLSGDTTINVTTDTNFIGTKENISNLATSTFSGSASYYMAGLAKWGASNDIRTDIVGKQTVTTFIIDVEEYKDCGYNSQFWFAAKYGNPPSYDLTTGNWIETQTAEQSWSQSLTLPPGACSSRAPGGYSSASGGNVTWPKNLLRAGDPLAMITSVRSAISNIAAQVGVESGLAQSSGSIDTGTGAYVYRAMYNSAGWTGDVVSLVVSTDGTISTTPAWSAAAKLPTPAARNIITFNDGQDASRANETSAYTRRGVAFTSGNFATQMSTYQQSALNKNFLGITDGYGANRVSFLRGERDGEAFLPGTTTPNPSINNRGFRSRTSVLGDFLNSTPLFVGSPQSSIPGSVYRTFANANANRRKMIYVGGNDGMLHAFDASYTTNATTGLPEITATSGAEVFAYVPSAVYPKLSQLTADNYSHKYFVDGTPIAADACFNACTFSADWKTVLIGGLNAGGQGIYALDITDPDTFDASKVLWEFNDQDDPDLGYTFGKPVVAKLNNNRWAVIFGNGFNNTASDGKVSTTGRAYLYIAYIEGPGAGNPWVEGTNYVKIALTDPAETATPNNPANGVGSVLAFDKNLDDKVDYVYATDRKGNLWKVDISSNDPANWGSAFGTTAAPLPLFTAETAAGGSQQYTTGLSIARHPYGGFMIVAGTGSWIDTTDVSTTNSDTLYGIWDKDDGQTRVTRADLQRQRALLYTNDLGTGGVTSSGDACELGSTGCLPCTGTTNGCVTIPSNCQPHYSSGTTVVTNVSPTCPSDIAYPVGTGTQLGWAYDLLPLASTPPSLPQSQLGSSVGERTYSDRPSILGSIVVFETLTPATDPCTGNTSGTDYNLSWFTGGAASTGVSLSVINSTGKVGLAGGTYAGQGVGSVTAVIGGRARGTGASKGAANLTIKREFCSALPPGTPGAPPAPCTGSACTGYIPGWGFLSNMAGAKSQPKRCICAAQSETTGNNTGILEKCQPKFIPAQIGRLTWKQITR